MTPITSIRIRRASTTASGYDCITLVMGDLHFHTDLVSDRQIRLAKLLADSHDTTPSRKVGTLGRWFDQSCGRCRDI